MVVMCVVVIDVIDASSIVRLDRETSPKQSLIRLCQS